MSAFAHVRSALTTPTLIVGLVGIVAVGVPEARALVGPDVQDAPSYRVASAVTIEPAQTVAPRVELSPKPEWVLPLSSYRLTAQFGATGYWSSTHTGLDFAAPSGTPILSIADGVVVSSGYDGAYGYKTVVQLEDGTEVWYCHQNSVVVSVGQSLAAGEVLGYVGATGNTTGAHLHLEMRPGGGDPVDPYDVLAAQGLFG
jgi:murein DD-endopeptidase MepM/ murein hydrolase activator NlpD